MEKEKEIRIIEQGSEDARLVSKAMASSTASELLDALSEGPKSATELETDTGYPLPTIQYHMGNLLRAGLVKVHKIRYSEKGKPMKLYAVSDTILVISPKKKNEEDVRPILRKYGFTATGFMIAVSAVVAVCGTVLKGGAVTPIPSTVLWSAIEFDTLKNTDVAKESLSVSEVIPLSISSPEVANDALKAVSVDTTGILLSQINLGMLIFLIVSLLILAGMMVFELVRIKKTKTDDF